MTPIEVVIKAATGDAEAKLNSFTSNLTGQFRQLAAQVTAAFTVGALIEFTRREIEAADQTGKLAQRLGDTTERISQLEHWFELGDVKGGEFTATLKLLNNSIAQGNPLLTEMGIATRDAVTGALRPMGDVLLDIADKFATYRDDASKTLAANQLFGRSGEQLIPILNQGRQGFKEAADQMDRMGGTVTPAMAKASNTLNDSLTVLFRQLRGIALSIAQEVLPYGQQFVTWLQGSVQSIREAVKYGAEFKDVLQGIASAALAAAIAIALMKVNTALVGAELFGGLKSLKDWIAALALLPNLLNHLALAKFGVAVAGITTLIYAGVEGWRAWQAKKEEALAVNSLEDFNRRLANQLRDRINTLEASGQLEVEQAKRLREALSRVARNDYDPRQAASILRSTFNSLPGQSNGAQQDLSGLEQFEKSSRATGPARRTSPRSSRSRN